MAKIMRNSLHEVNYIPEYKNLYHILALHELFSTPNASYSKEEILEHFLNLPFPLENLSNSSFTRYIKTVEVLLGVRIEYSQKSKKYERVGSSTHSLSIHTRLLNDGIKALMFESYPGFLSGRLIDTQNYGTFSYISTIYELVKALSNNHKVNIEYVSYHSQIDDYILNKILTKGAYTPNVIVSKQLKKEDSVATKFTKTVIPQAFKQIGGITYLIYQLTSKSELKTIPIHELEKVTEISDEKHHLQLPMKQIQDTFQHLLGVDTQYCTFGEPIDITLFIDKKTAHFFSTNKLHASQEIVNDNYMKLHLIPDMELINQVCNPHHCIMVQQPKWLAKVIYDLNIQRNKFQKLIADTENTDTKNPLAKCILR